MKRIAILGLVVTLLLMAMAAPVMAKSTTVQVWWLEDAERYGGDGTWLQSWVDGRIPDPEDAPVESIEFIKTGKAYHAGMELFYNYYPLDDFVASPLVIANGKFAAWARYTSPASGLPILDKIRGRLTIDDGTAYGSYVQYSYVEGVTDEETVTSSYPNAVATDEPDIWLIGITYYTVHGQQ